MSTRQNLILTGSVIFALTQFAFAQSPLQVKWFVDAGTFTQIIGVAQMDDDPNLEMVVVMSSTSNNQDSTLFDGTVFVFNALTGAVKAFAAGPGSNEPAEFQNLTFGSVKLADIDGDNKHEIIIGADEIIVVYEFGSSTGVNSENNELITTYSLNQNYPNPFNPSTTIEYSVQKAEKVTIKIYNGIGQLVRTLVNTEKMIGEYSIVWDGNNDRGKHIASGTYYYQLQVGEFTSTKKMLLIK